MQENRIIFCDNHLLVLDKPGGLVTQPADGQADSLEDQGKAWLKERFSKPGNVFLEAVHRIDKFVCGAVLFARTSKALSRLNSQMREGAISKFYRAWVEGTINGTNILLQDFLVHDDFHARIVSESTPGAKCCRLHYTVLDHAKDRTLVEIALETGRYHQIRAQFSHCGHPIFGDQRYGSRHVLANDCIALQSYRISFKHPVGNQPMDLTSGIDLHDLF